MKLIENRAIVGTMDASHLHIPPGALDLPRVLLVEHPTPVAARLAAALTGAGMEVELAASGPEAVQVMERFRPGIVLLHAADGAADGLERLLLLTRGGDCGVIVMLGRDGEAARIGSLDDGADDVLSVRTPPGEIAARIRAVLRRVARGQAVAGYESSRPIQLDPGHRCVIGPQGERTLLSEAEFTALETLLDADGAAVSRDWLGRIALKRPLHSEDRSVDQLMLKLRRKLVAAGASERTILSARRHGYVIPDPSRFRSIAITASDSPSQSPPVRA